MSEASWRRHFSVEDGLDKFSSLQIKRPHIDDRKKGRGYKRTESRPHASTSRSGYASDGSSSGFHTSRSRDLSEEIHLPNRIGVLSDEINDVSDDRYYSADELDSENYSNITRETSESPKWRAKYESNRDKTRKPSRTKDIGFGKNEPRHDDSWGFMASDELSGISPSVNTNTSYNDFDGTGSSASGSLFVPRPKNVRSTPNLHNMSATLESNQRRKGKRPRGESPHGTHTSGYCSNNTYSEMSDFTNYNKSNDQRKFKTLPPPNKQDGGIDNEGYSSRRSKEDHYRRRSSSTLDDRSPRTPRPLYTRSISANESDISMSSKDRSSKSTEKEKRGSSNSLDSRHHSTLDTKSHKVPSIGNVSVTVTNNIQYDPNDPFSFIQPIDLPFHKKVRKCMGPIVAVILLLILAAALGAAIYFASELKDTQAKQIDLLRANLAMKIRNADEIPNADSLTSQDMMNISRTYCKQMDIFYAKSEFKETYRGCEVISFKNSYLNFTLFFVEKEATSSQIIGVIESSAEKIQDEKQTVAVVDKFELELNDVKVTMERRMEPETFNKKTVTDPQPTTTGQPHTHHPTKAVTKTTPRIPHKTTSKNKPVYSWTPCESGYKGTYFPHPTDCAKFFHCSNRISIERNCTRGLLYDWREFTCVSRFTPNIECPDPRKAPPRPTTQPTKITTTTAEETTADPFAIFYEDEAVEGSTRPSKSPDGQSRTAVAGRYSGRPRSTRPSKSPDGQSRTAVVGRYSGRPSYDPKPCNPGTDGRLYPHPTDCAHFIQCVNGREMIMNCSGGLVFSPKDRACIFPPNPELVCPDIEPCKDQDTGYFPHPFDCTKFIQCQNKKEIILSCSNGLVWSPTVNSCIHDSNNSASCQGLTST